MAHFLLKSSGIFECDKTFHIVFVFFCQAHFIRNLPMISKSALMLLRMVNLSFNEFDVSNECLILSIVDLVHLILRKINFQQSY